jgi:hypothetical protein
MMVSAYQSRAEGITRLGAVAPKFELVNSAAKRSDGPGEAYMGLASENKAASGCNGVATDIEWRERVSV